MPLEPSLPFCRRVTYAAFSAVFFLLVSGLTSADELQLNPNHPTRYTVVKGDTLWDISARFLKSPWHWPKIWKINDQVSNPHLIYPGNVIVLRMVDGRPELSIEGKETGTTKEAVPSFSAAEKDSTAGTETVPNDGRTTKLSPGVHSESLDSAIPTISPSSILPYLTRPLAVDSSELAEAGYVTIGLDDRIALGNKSQFYARGLDDPAIEYYSVFRPGKAIHHPETGEFLAFEALYLGDAQLLELGDPSKLVVTQVKQEIVPSDRLLVAPRQVSAPYYYPHPPKAQVQGRIVSALNAVAELGSHSVVGISLGTREGMDEGTVLRIMRHAGKSKDPMTRKNYALPDEETGLLLVFRTYEKMSYGLVMSATQPVHLLDTVITP